MPWAKPKSEGSTARARRRAAGSELEIFGRVADLFDVAAVGVDAGGVVRDSNLVSGVVSVLRGPDQHFLAVRGMPDPQGGDNVMLTAADITAAVAEAVGTVETDRCLDVAFKRAPQAMALLGTDGRIVRINSSFHDLLGRDEASIVGRLPDEFAPPEDRGITLLPLRRLADGSSRRETWVRRLIRGDGTVVTLRVSAVPLANAQGRPTTVFTTYEAISPQAADRPRPVAATDRDALLSQIDDWRTDDPDTTVALLVVHLHGLREANASHGHRAGDELLHEAMRRLRSLAPPRSVVALLGLEDVAVAWPGGAVPARRLARRAESALDTVVDTTVGDLYLGYSLGLASARPQQSAASLLADAQLAVGRSMATGPSPLVEYEPALRAAALEELRIEQEVRDAVVHDRVVVLVQPIVDISSGRLVSMEALMRLRTATGGELVPDVFLEAAERTGAIVALGDAVLDRACAQLASWRQAGIVDPDVTIKVNVSATQLLRQHAAQQVLATLQRHALPTTALGLEITEGVLLDLSERTMRQLAHLVDEGVQLGLDDVGTGWASLSAISQLPLNFLKIDKSFVGGMSPDARQRGDIAVVSALLALGRTAKLDVVAEGVETAEQEAQLLSFGARLGQGFRYARPLPMREFAHQFLRSRRD